MNKIISVEMEKITEIIHRLKNIDCTASAVIDYVKFVTPEMLNSRRKTIFVKDLKILD